MATITVSLNAGIAGPLADPVTVNAALLTLLGTPGVTLVLESADLPTGGVTEAKIANGAVSKAKLADDQKLHSGLIMAYAGASLPTGWLLCDGSAVSRELNADLFTAVGTTHGAGNGSTTFNLPDLRDRFIIGKSATKVLGSTGGTATVNLEHSHTLPATTGSTTLTGAQSGVAAHDHASGINNNGYTARYGNATVASAPGASSWVDTTNTLVFKTSTATAANAAEGHTHTIGGSTAPAGSTTQSILPPYVALSYLIKT
jgi:microcystin-dependent protein